jgi:hypothetical protein
MWSDSFDERLVNIQYERLLAAAKNVYGEDLLEGLDQNLKDLAASMARVMAEPVEPLVDWPDLTVQKR